MNAALRWLRSLCAWRNVRDTGVHVYRQNDVTGRRRVFRISAGGHQPVDKGWIETGIWTRHPLPPARNPDSIFPRFDINVQLPSGTRNPRVDS